MLKPNNLIHYWNWKIFREIECGVKRSQFENETKYINHNVFNSTFYLIESWVSSLKYKYKTYDKQSHRCQDVDLNNKSQRISFH